MSKGSARRPMAIPEAEMRENWARTFGAKCTPFVDDLIFLAGSLEPDAHGDYVARLDVEGE